MFVIARFLLGFGIPFAIVAASSMIGELAYPKERARIGSLFNSSWFIGAIVAAGVTLGTFAMPTNWGWRIPSILQVCPSALQLIFIWFLPESPRSVTAYSQYLFYWKMLILNSSLRWLIAKGRGDEAYAILTKYHAEGDINSPFVRAEYVRILYWISRTQILIRNNVAGTPKLKRLWSSSAKVLRRHGKSFSRPPVCVNVYLSGPFSDLLHNGAVTAWPREFTLNG